MPYDSSQKTITAPINIEEIAAAFGVGSSDLGQIYVKAGENATVNPWAMYKPVRGNTGAVGMVNRPNSGSGYLQNLGIGNASGVFGPPSATTVQGLIDLYHDMTTPTSPTELPEYILFGGKRANGWRYLYPRGGSYSPKEWFRMYDVLPVKNLALQSGIGYHGNAGNPFGTFDCTPSLPKSYGVFNAGQIPPRTYTTGVPEHDIVIEDVNPASNGMNYYGVLLVPVDDLDGNWVTSKAARLIQQADASTAQTIWTKKGSGAVRGKESEYLGIDSLQTSINDAWTTDYDYMVYPFLTNGLFITTSGGGRVVDVPYSDRASTGRVNDRILYSIPGVIPQRVRFTLYSVVITIYATKCVVSGSGMTSNVYYTVENKSNNAVTLQNLKMYFRKSKTTTPGTRAAGEVDYIMSNGACYRTDDTHSGTRDSTYDSFLANISNLAISGSVRRPTSGVMTITFPNTDISVLWIGATQNVATWGSAILQFSPQPHDPTDNNA